METEKDLKVKDVHSVFLYKCTVHSTYYFK